MAKVYNWHLKRKVEYPYEESRPRRQIVWVFDLNKCIECQTCTIACKTTWTSGKGQEYMLWNNVEVKPYGGYPLGWDVNILKKHKRAGNKKTLFEVAPNGEVVLGYLPEDEDYMYPNFGEDVSYGTIEKGAFFNGIHQVWMFYLPRICNHCSYPACLSACPRKAIYKRKEDGIVLVDQERCRGYRECVKACPYKKVFFNAVSRISEKCIACYPLIERGEQPRCVQTCIGRIRIQGFIDPKGKPDPDNPLDYLIRIKRVAVPMYPQFGLEPNVYYIPPVHVPRQFLYQMFGGKEMVENAIGTYLTAKKDRKLLGAMLLFGSTDKIIHRFKVDRKYAYGYDKDGKLVAKVPFNEPIYIRPLYDRKRDVYRHSIP